MEPRHEEGLRELEALGCADAGVNATLLDHFDLDVGRLLDTLAPCRDCKKFVLRSVSAFEDRATQLKKVKRAFCSCGFNNTAYNVPPTYMCSWGYGYYLCCNCSLRDGWLQENYDAHACGTCQHQLHDKVGLHQARRTSSAG
jgi:hypothetical protein